LRYERWVRSPSYHLKIAPDALKIAPVVPRFAVHAHSEHYGSDLGPD
jgi:hypothetical protein